MKMRKYVYWVMALMTALTLPACERLFIDPDPSNNPVENFDLLWKSVDEKYSFFEFKDIDWNEVRSRYRPQVSMDMSDKELFYLMADMLYELRDGHVNLTSYFDRSRNWDWYLDYPPNFNPIILERNYLGRDFQIVGPFETKVIGNVGYIYYGSFMGFFEEGLLDRLLERYAHLDGLIIDVRDNTGGIAMLAPRLASRFVTEKTLVGYNRYKEGPGRDDFSRLMPIYIEPKGTSFTKPVIVLTNRKVYSAGNLFASYMSHLPHVILMGDHTGGGGGLPYSGELMNGWRFRFSSSQILNADLEHIEHGVAPDVKVDMLLEDELAGLDTILERALEYMAGS
jgi:hypothetical protein